MESAVARRYILLRSREGNHAGYARLAGFRIGDPLLIGFANAIDRDGNLASLFATDRHGERIVEISSQ